MSGLARSQEVEFSADRTMDYVTTHSSINSRPVCCSTNLTPASYATVWRGSNCSQQVRFDSKYPYLLTYLPTTYLRLLRSCWRSRRQRKTRGMTIFRCANVITEYRTVLMQCLKLSKKDWTSTRSLGIQWSRTCEEVTWNHEQVSQSLFYPSRHL